MTNSHGDSMHPDERRPTKAREILFRLFTLVFGVLLLLFLFEAGLRIFSPEITPRGTSAGLVIDSLYGSTPGLHANASGLTGNARVEIDALGFWKYSAQPDTAAEGWLLLGDSVTMGINVESDSTFAGRLAQASKRYRVMNASWVGYSSADYLAAAKAIVPAFANDGGRHPKITRATVFWTLNDIYSDCGIGLPPGQTLRDQSGAILGWLRRNYITYLWLKNICFDRSEEYFLYDLQYYRPGDVRFRSSIAKLDSLRRLCTDHSVTLDVVLLPYEYQIRTGDAGDHLPQRLMASALDSLGIPWTDASAAPEFRSAASKDFYLFGDGIHFSDLGHRAMFDVLSRADRAR